MEYMTLREGPITKETLQNLKETVVKESVERVATMALFDMKRGMFRKIMNSDTSQHILPIANIHVEYGGTEYPGILSDQKDAIVDLLMKKLTESFPDSTITTNHAKTYILIDWT